MHWSERVERPANLKQAQMRVRAVIVAAVALLFLAMTMSARAAVSAHVVETHPAGTPIALARNEAFYVRIAYATDRPVSVWARPYLRGKEVAAKSNASIPHEGTGEALGWFEPVAPGDVDEIRILAGDGTTAGTRVVSSYGVQLSTTDTATPRAERPRWIDTMSRHEEAVRRADYERRMREPVSAGDSMFMSGFMLAMLALLVAGCAWPVWSVWKWRGGWRFLAAVPVAVMALVVLRIVVDTARNPTSHNLWPFEILIWGGASLLFMLVLKAGRGWLQAPPP